MKLIKRDNFWNDPFAEFDRWIDRAFTGNPGWAGLLGADPFSAARNFRLDIHDDADNYYVVAELPGVERKDVDVQIENAVLTISAKRKQGEDESAAEVSFSRSVTISDDIDAGRVTAKLEDGLLRVTLPKAEARKPKAITVE